MTDKTKDEDNEDDGYLNLKTPVKLEKKKEK